MNSTQIKYVVMFIGLVTGIIILKSAIYDVIKFDISGFFIGGFVGLFLKTMYDRKMGIKN